MKYALIISEAAEKDVEGAYQWLASQMPSHATKWYQDLLAAIETLRFHPARCPQCRERHPFQFIVRQLIYGRRRGRHRIVFTIEKRTVTILRVLHCSRKGLSGDNVEEES